MGIAQSFERRLEQFVEGFFARTFRSGLQPVELARKIAREMDRGKTLTQNGVVVANHFLIHLSAEDNERFGHFAQALRQELKAGLSEECQKEGWRTLGPIQIDLITDDNLKIGRYVIDSHILEGEFENEFNQHHIPAAQHAQASPVVPVHSEPVRTAPAVPSSPRIESSSGTTVHLADGPILIGRLDDCALRFDDPNVSRHHAEIGPDVSGHWSVNDLGSTNGTYVNGIRIGGPTPLRDGDQMSVGRNTLTFRT